ncbi:hypothetical protein cypCar_00028618 [Cyprinus carpio]|nr:hypothetical protein cypCar_00028618 [Cyprinus carpio]
MPPFGKVDKYKIYVPRMDRPGLIYDQILSADVSSQVIDTLEEDKEYSVDIYTIYPEGPMKLVAVDQLLVQNATTDTVQARWSSVRGATGYRLTWSSSENVNLGDNFNFYLVQGLHSGTEYTIIINPIFVDTEGPVTSAKAKTLKSSAVQTLRAFAVSSSSTVTSWNAVPGATVYRLAWGPTAEFVIPQSQYLVRSILKHSITGLQPQTLYSVSIQALYSNTEGPENSKQESYTNKS